MMMVNFSVSKSSLLLLFLVVANLAVVVQAQTIPAPERLPCEGEELRVLSHGCLDATACREAAEAMGLQLGNLNGQPGWTFEGDWADKGCFYYADDHPLYPNQAYFGTGGTCPELKMRPMAEAIRISCDGSTKPPFDPRLCQDVSCLDAVSCSAAAVQYGLQLGNDEESFAGPYHVKGCVYYPSDHPEYPNQAYWGSGASFCGQLRADPSTYDGSLRLDCNGNVQVGGSTSSSSNTVVSGADSIVGQGEGAQDDINQVPSSPTPQQQQQQQQQTQEPPRPSQQPQQQQQEEQEQSRPTQQQQPGSGSGGGGVLTEESRPQQQQQQESGSTNTPPIIENEDPPVQAAESDNNDNQGFDPTTTSNAGNDPFPSEEEQEEQLPQDTTTDEQVSTTGFSVSAIEGQESATSGSSIRYIPSSSVLVIGAIVVLTTLTTTTL